MQALRYETLILVCEKNDGKDNVISMTKGIVQTAWHISGQLQVRKTLNLFIEFTIIIHTRFLHELVASKNCSAYV